MTNFYQSPMQAQWEPTNRQNQWRPQTAQPLYGRVVSPNEQPNPTEIPSDGTTAIFPVSDGSAILAYWVNNGTIQNARYIPETQTAQTAQTTQTAQPSEEAKQAEDTFHNDTLNYLKSIDEHLNKLAESFNN